MMADLLWPGDHRAGDHLTDAAVVRAALQVETTRCSCTRC